MEGKKVCLRCGHPACRSCGDWCDVILYSPSDSGYHDMSGVTAKFEANEEGFSISRGGDYPMLCCGGQCVYTEDELARRKLMEEK